MNSSYNDLVDILVFARKSNSRIIMKQSLLNFLYKFENIIDNIKDYTELTDFVVTDDRFLFESDINEINKNGVEIKITTDGLFSQSLEYIRIENFEVVSKTC